MRAHAIKRIAADLSALHDALPPNYLWPEDAAQEDLSILDILLVGPANTPFGEGLWRLHFDLPADYPQQPPTANFRTPIFHPNVDPQTGSICVETLKRDWSSSLTLRDLLVTITCLLIQPNPDSALNAEAGALIQENYDLFARRAHLLTSIHAKIPTSLAAAAKQAQQRGESPVMPARRRPVARRQMRRSDGSPVAQLARRRQAREPTTPESDHKAMSDDQENAQQPLAPTPSRSTPRRPAGTPMPLQELIMDSSGDEMVIEYPPSPRKSPRKAARGTYASTLPTPAISFEHQLAQTPLLSPKGKERAIEPEPAYGISEQYLWSLCNHEIERWNRGDFRPSPWPLVASRW